MIRLVETRLEGGENNFVTSGIAQQNVTLNSIQRSEQEWRKHACQNPRSLLTYLNVRLYTNISNSISYEPEGSTQHSRCV